MCLLPLIQRVFYFMEVWKDIKGYEGYYQVSNLGGVKSVDRIITTENGVIQKYKEKKLSLGDSGRGYKVITLNKNGKRKRFKVHRLVAIAFLANPENKPQVNHIDGIRDNNKIENLEWVTGSENVQHAFDNGLKKSSKGQSHGMSILTEDKVLEIRAIYAKGGISQKKLGLLFGVCESSVRNIVNKISWTHI